LEQPDKFRIGSILVDTFGVIRRNMVLCVGLALITYALPRFWLTLWYWEYLTAGTSGDSDYSMQRVAVIVITVIGYVILGAILQVALTHATIVDLSGKRPSIRDCFQATLSVLLPAIVVSLLATFGAWIGLLLLIVPGLLLFARWSVVIPVLTHERLGVFATMRRSRDLVEGRNWALVGFWLVVIVASVAAGFALNDFFFSFGTELGFFLDTLADTAQIVVVSVALAVMYVELRRLREGISIEDLAEIFS
jgi:hypothetical protein